MHYFLPLGVTQSEQMLPPIDICETGERCSYVLHLHESLWLQRSSVADRMEI